MKKKINSTEYTFQKLPAMEMVRLKERATDTSGNLVESLLFEELAEHVIVNPRLDLEEFEDYGELMEIMKVALDFQLAKSQRKGKPTES